MIGIHGTSSMEEVSVTINVLPVLVPTMVNVLPVNQEKFSATDGVETKHLLDFTIMEEHVLLVILLVPPVQDQVTDNVKAVTLISFSMALEPVTNATPLA